VARFDAVASRIGPAGEGFARCLDMATLIGDTTSAEQFRADVGRAAEVGFTDVVTAGRSLRRR
jgi:hypothetical protein